MCFVEDPGTDFALFQYIAHCPVAQLLRSDQKNADVAQPDAFQGLAALGHGQQAVDGRHAMVPLVFQPFDLVFHQGDQR